MKRIATLAASILLIVNSAYAIVVGYSRSVGDVFTCSSTPYASAVTATSQYNVGSATNFFYQGFIINSEQSTRSVCSVDFSIKAIYGDVSNKNFNVKIYSSSWVLKATSTTVPGSSISELTWQRFSFTSPVSVSEGDRVLLTMGEVDSTNYISIYYQSANIDSGYAHYARLYENGTLHFESDTIDIAYKIYAVE